MHDEKLLKTEQLLREAAEWEPSDAPPAALTRAALTTALEQERRMAPRPPRTTMFFTLALGGGMAATSVAAALWAVAVPQPGLAGRPQPLMKAELATIRKDPVPVDFQKPTPHKSGIAPVLPAPRVHLAAETPPARSLARPRRVARTVRRRTVRTKPPLPRAQWDTEEVERRQAGLLGPAVLIQPGPSSDTVYIQPGVVTIPLDNPQVACTPPDRPEGSEPEDPELEVPKSEPPGSEPKEGMPPPAEPPGTGGEKEQKR